MQQSQTNKTIALVVLLLVLIAILPAYYLLYLRHRLYKRFQAEMLQRQHVENLEDEIRRTQLEQAGLHVSNAVLDNCLSTLKHETMYYPSRIRQLADQGDMASLTEVAVYYRELYGLLTEQAMSQVERVQLRLKALEPTVFNLPPSPFRILGDENLLRYLFEILKKQGGQKRMEATMDWHDAKYVGISVSMPGMHLSDAEAARLFTPSVENIPYLLCRQIVRDHGEATNRRGCSIRGETGTDGVTRIVITLPRAYQQ